MMMVNWLKKENMSRIDNFIRTSNEAVEETVNNFGYKLLDIYRDEKEKIRVILTDDNKYKYDVGFSSLKSNKGRTLIFSAPV